MQIDFEDYSEFPDEYGQDDILTGFVKGMGGITLALIGGSLLAIYLITRKAKD